MWGCSFIGQKYCTVFCRIFLVLENSLIWGCRADDPQTPHSPALRLSAYRFIRGPCPLDPANSKHIQKGQSIGKFPQMQYFIIDQLKYIPIIKNLREPYS